MANRVYIHIGAPKSGTTYLQTVLWTNQSRLGEQGVLLPGRRRGDHNSAAVWGRTQEPRPGTARIWDRLGTQIREWDGHAILSSEWFTMLDHELAGRLVAEFVPAEVHLIFTARNFVSSVPAAWQERLKLGDSLGLDAFVVSLDAGDNPRWNWGTLDPSAVLPRWSHHVDPSRIHVVTVPPPGSAPDLLWKRFSGAAEIASDAVDLDKAFANESIGVESARLLQLIGPELRKAVDADTIGGNLPYRWIRNYLSHEVLAQRRGTKIGLPQKDVDALVERSERVVERLEGAGYTVHGDLADLMQGRNPAGAVEPDLVGDAVVMEVALSVIPEMLGELRRTRERLDRSMTELTELQQMLDEQHPSADRADTGSDPPSQGADRPRRPRGKRWRLRR